MIESVPLFGGDLLGALRDRIVSMRAEGASDDDVKAELDWIAALIREIREDHRRAEGWYE